jgi:hypothetical protein
MSAMRRYLGGVATALLTLGTLAPCAFTQGTTGHNVMILFETSRRQRGAFTHRILSHHQLSRMPDVEIAAGPSGRGSGDGGTLA